jgi:superfamily II DNA/RNA helicase
VIYLSKHHHHATGSVLVFVDTQEKCDQLYLDLLKSGYPCLSLHGGKDQLDRDHTLHEFKKVGLCIIFLLCHLVMPLRLGIYVNV